MLPPAYSLLPNELGNRIFPFLHSGMEVFLFRIIKKASHFSKKEKREDLKYGA